MANSLPSFQPSPRAASRHNCAPTGMPSTPAPSRSTGPPPARLRRDRDRSVDLPRTRHRPLKALDASSYDDAEIVHDLNRSLPNHLKATADFIVDGSTLDNVFDSAMTLRNYAQLLRPGSRLLAINMFNNRQCAFTICSPDWFLDYFVENGFSDCSKTKRHIAFCAQHSDSSSSFYPNSPPTLHVSIAMSSFAGLLPRPFRHDRAMLHTWARDK